jgi:ATP-binding cassette subfamily B (MDR/TAP) protein 1
MDVPILTDVSFTLTPGECVAIVGPSGSGKSTIAALLQRLYDPTGGSIIMDKYDLSRADTKWLRNHIAAVSQSANLFDASVSANIAYGSEVSPEEIKRAAKSANIHDFIMSLPLGYDTNLGENASLISGGQAQRLQIARALVRRSHILILDECTSALDVDNQRAILDTIVKIKGVSCAPHLMRSIADRTATCYSVHYALGGSYETL